MPSASGSLRCTSSRGSPRQFHETKKKFINPTKTVQSVAARLEKYKSGNQEDAHEFLMDFLQELHEETKTEQTPSLEKTPTSNRASKTNRLSNLRMFAEGSELEAVKQDNESGRSDAGLLRRDPWPPKQRRDPWKVFYAAERSAVTDVCFGMLEMRVMCLGCQRSGISYEPFKYASLDQLDLARHRRPGRSRAEQPGPADRAGRADRAD